MSRAEAVLWRMRTIFDRVLPVANRVPIGERTVCVGSDRLFVDSIDRALAAVAWKLGLLEGPERRLIARVVQPGMIAVDVGANIGLHTLALARRVGDGGVVIAVEPDPSNFRLLARAVTSAGLSQVRMIQAAAADRGGEGILHVSPANRGDHRLHAREATSTRVVVRTVTVDELLTNVGGRLDFLKIDVQGAESLVVAGVASSLQRSPGVVVLCELSPELLRRAGASVDDVLAQFGAVGLRPHRLHDDGDASPIPAAEVHRCAEDAGYVNIVFARA